MMCSRLPLIAAAVMLSGLGAARAAASDLVFGDFESGLDPNLDVVQFNAPPDNQNRFNGSVTTGVTHGTMSGCFTTAPGFQQYLRYNNNDISPGSVAGELNNYNDLAFDINVPGGSDPSAFFINQIVINATGFGFFQSGDLDVNDPPPPGGQPPKDVKGRDTVTVDWNYRADPSFASKYAAFMQNAGAGSYFQVLLVSNWGGMDPSIGTFTIDNLRLTNPVNTAPIPGDANMDGKVNFADLLILAQHYGKSPDEMFGDGDFNNDGGVGFDDLLILAQNYGFGTGQAAAAAAVPEPASLAMFAVTAAAFARRRRRR
jgi:hypothetical protein